MSNTDCTSCIFKITRPLTPVTLFFSIALLGCGSSESDAPKTYKVTGKIVQADGKPFTGGMVEFHSKADSSQTTMGEVKSDGTFALTTMTGKEKLDGAIEGMYTVTITPMLTQDQMEQGDVGSIRLRKTFEVKANDNNQFTIKLDR